MNILLASEPDVPLEVVPVSVEVEVAVPRLSSRHGHVEETNLRRGQVR